MKACLVQDIIYQTAMPARLARIAHAPRPSPSWLDRWGIFISSICLVHCLALPIVIALLPAMSSFLPPDNWVHPVLIGLALPVTGVALMRGYLTHRAWRAPLLGAAGLALISAGVLLDALPVAAAILTVAGGLLVAAAHVTNWRAHGAMGAHHHGFRTHPAH